jgi:hypothetical protein
LSESLSAILFLDPLLQLLIGNDIEIVLITAFNPVVAILICLILHHNIVSGLIYLLSHLVRFFHRRRRLIIYVFLKLEEDIIQVF